MKTVFIVLTIIFVLSFLFFIFYPLIKRSVLKRNFVRSYGRSVYQIANYYDYYLINTLLLKANDDSTIDIDHLLLANKFIFVIKDYYFNGSLHGKDTDNSWVYYYGRVNRPNKRFIKNPLKENSERLRKLSLVTGLEQSLLIPVVLINDDCDLSYESKNDSDNFVIKRKDFKNLVSSIENRDVAPLKEDQLSYAVKDIAELNLRKHK